MATTDIYGQGIAAAVLSDKPDAQSLAKAIADGAAKYGIKVYANASNRGAVLVGASAATVGMVTYLIAEDRIDYYNGSTWVAVTPGPWIPLTYGSGITANSGSPAYRVVNGSVELRGTLRKNDNSSFATGDTHLATLPAGTWPGYFRYYITATQWNSGIFARIEIDPSNGHVNALITSTGTNATWIGLDGISSSL